MKNLQTTEEKKDLVRSIKERDTIISELLTVIENQAEILNQLMTYHKIAHEEVISMRIEQDKKSRK